MVTDVLSVKGVLFGEGKPKICVPIVERNKETILSYAEKVLEFHPDMIEIRVDWFEGVNQVESVIALLRDLRMVIGDTLLLMTVRTKNEGGEFEGTVEEYRTLCIKACESGWIDFVDVEAFMDEGLLLDITSIAHDCDVCVIASNHDFEKTPDEQEIVRRLKYMDEQGADLPKIAVMPNCERDVLTLLSATLRYREQGGKKPVITMAMDAMGLISRLTGELVGSAVTFATAGRVSAPGQIHVNDMQPILEVMHFDR